MEIFERWITNEIAQAHTVVKAYVVICLGYLVICTCHHENKLMVRTLLTFVDTHWPG